MKTKLLIIDSLDHFCTDNPKVKKCIIRHIGEFYGEDENYIRLKHMESISEDIIINMDIDNILKCAIVNKKEIEITIPKLKEMLKCDLMKT